MACCLCDNLKNYHGEKCKWCNKEKCKFYYNSDCVYCKNALFCIPAEILLDAIRTGKNSITRVNNDEICSTAKEDYEKLKKLW